MASAEFWLVAGPNGAGKTTLTQSQPIVSLLPHVSLLNPDARTDELLRRRGFAQFSAVPEAVLAATFAEAASEILDEPCRSEKVPQRP